MTDQFPKNFLRPYVPVEKPPSEAIVFKRIKPISCEWLKRTKVAMSEMVETLNTNMDILMNKQTTLLSKEGMQKYQRKLKPLVKSIANLDNKNQPNATSGDVKGVLKFFVGADNETDALIDEAMEVGAALFVTATQLTVARTLFLQHISSADEEESKIAMEMPIQRHPPEKTKKRNLSDSENVQVEAENTTKKDKKSKKKTRAKPNQNKAKLKKRTSIRAKNESSKMKIQKYNCYTW